MTHRSLRTLMPEVNRVCRMSTIEESAVPYAHGYRLPGLDDAPYDRRGALPANNLFCCRVVLLSYFVAEDPPEKTAFNPEHAVTIDATWRSAELRPPVWSKLAAAATEAF